MGWRGGRGGGGNDLLSAGFDRTCHITSCSVPSPLTVLTLTANDDTNVPSNSIRPLTPPTFPKSVKTQNRAPGANPSDKSDTTTIKCNETHPDVSNLIKEMIAPPHKFQEWVCGNCCSCPPQHICNLKHTHPGPAALQLQKPYLSGHKVSGHQQEGRVNI